MLIQNYKGRERKRAIEKRVERGIKTKIDQEIQLD